MKALLNTSILLLSFIWVLPAMAGSITVTASSEAEIVPDTAKIMLQIRSVESRASYSRDNVNRTLDELKISLRSLGISANDIEKSNIKQGNEYGYIEGKRVINGYYASIDVTVNVSRLANLQKIYDQIALKNKISIISTDFKIVNQQAQEDKQLVLALQKAKHKAQIMANAYKQTLGRAISIIEVNSQVMPYPQARTMSIESNGADEPGYESVTVKVQVQVEFNLN